MFWIFARVLMCLLRCSEWCVVRCYVVARVGVGAKMFWCCYAVCYGVLCSW